MAVTVAQAVVLVGAVVLTVAEQGHKAVTVAVATTPQVAVVVLALQVLMD
jgi:hypothetical protein